MSKNFDYAKDCPYLLSHKVLPVDGNLFRLLLCFSTLAMFVTYNQ